MKEPLLLLTTDSFKSQYCLLPCGVGVWKPRGRKRFSSPSSAFFSTLYPQLLTSHNGVINHLLCANKSNVFMSLGRIKWMPWAVRLVISVSVYTGDACWQGTRSQRPRLELR